VNAEVEAVIGRIPQLRGRKVVVEPLGGGLTNRNFHIECGRERFVLRIAGENSGQLGINRRVEYACAQAAFAAGIGPEVVAFFPRRRAMVSRFVPGKVLAGRDVRQPGILRRVVESLRRYHEGPVGKGTFSVFKTVRKYYADAAKPTNPFPPEIDAAWEILARVEREAGTPDRLRPCHNDLLPANFVHHRGRVWILDWEYAGAGDLFFDLGNLAANGSFKREDEIRLLKLYFGKTRAVDLRRLQLMRLASDMREAMWGFLQMQISKLEFDYQTYALDHLDRFLKRAGRMFD